MDAPSTTPKTSLQSFLKQWGMLIAFGLFVIGSFTAFRIWTEAKAESAVIAEYAGFLDFLAQGSRQANDYRQAYFTKFKRTTVASKHFEQVCGVMHRLAVTDGLAPKSHSKPMSRGCEELASFYRDTTLPE